MRDWSVFGDGKVRLDGEEVSAATIVNEIQRLTKALDDLRGFINSIIGREVR